MKRIEKKIMNSQVLSIFPIFHDCVFVARIEKPTIFFQDSRFLIVQTHSTYSWVSNTFKYLLDQTKGNSKNEILTNTKFWSFKKSLKLKSDAWASVIKLRIKYVQYIIMYLFWSSMMIQLAFRSFQINFESRQKIEA